MNSPLALVCTLALAAPAVGQMPFPPIPGYNVGLNPSAFVQPLSSSGSVMFWMLVPGDQPIATFHDPSTMPAGTTTIRLDILAWAVFEPRACAVGAGLFFDTQAPLAITPVATVGTTGWNLYVSFQSLAYASDPFQSTWSLSYCSVSRCTSPCGPMDRDPSWEIYFMAAR